MPKNVQTTTQLHSFHMLARSCSRCSKLGFNNMWTKNFQMYKLDLEKAEEPEVKLPTSVGSKSKRIPEKHLPWLHWLCQSLWLCKSWQIVEIFKEMAIPDHLNCLLWNLYADQEATVRTRHGTTDWFQMGKGVHQAVYCHPAYLLPCRVHHTKCWAGWSTS